MHISNQILVFSNAAGCLTARPAGYAVLRFAPGSWDVPELAELLTQAGALLLHRNWTCLLADARQLPGFSEEALAWIRQNWLTRVIPQPPRLYKALLLPDCPDAGGCIGQLREQASAFTQYAYFADEEAAHNYLLTLAS